MCGRKLKNYDKYLEKLELYAQASGIKVEFKTEPGDGVYIPTIRKIRIDPDLEDSTTLSTFLHELGHYQDDMNTGLEKPSLHNAYENIYKNKATEKQIELVYDCEKEAWSHAEILAKKLRIPLGNWYFKEKASALKGYRS